MPVVLLIIGHLFLATGLGDRAKLRGWWRASCSVAAHLATPWIVRYAGGRVAFLHAITGIALTLTMSVLTIYPVLAMWRGDRSRNSGSRTDRPAARAHRGLKHSRAPSGCRASHRISPDVDIQGNALETDPCLVAGGRPRGFHCWRVAAVRRSPTTRAETFSSTTRTTTRRRPASRSRRSRPPPAADADICWSNVVDDLQCHPVSATADLDNVSLLRVAHLSHGAGRRSGSPRARCRSRTSPDTSTSTPTTAAPARSCPSSRSSAR